MLRSVRNGHLKFLKQDKTMINQETSVLKTIVVNDPTELSEEGIKAFSNIFRNQDYQIVTFAAKSYELTGINPILQTDQSYQTVLDDEQSTYHGFAVQYQLNDTEIQIPLGVYGVSPKFKMRFPLLINGFWRIFLMIGKEQFCALFNIKENQDTYYQSLRDQREHFVHKIFDYYNALGDDTTSAMAWGIRNKQSLTRSTAESLGYRRTEFIETNDEIYSSDELSQEQWDYLKSCTGRWMNVIPEDQKKPASSMNQFNMNTILLGRCLVGYQ